MANEEIVKVNNTEWRVRACKPGYAGECVSHNATPCFAKTRDGLMALMQDEAAECEIFAMQTKDDFLKDSQPCSLDKMTECESCE